MSRVIVRLFFLITIFASTTPVAMAVPLIDGEAVNAVFTSTQQVHLFTFSASTGHSVFFTVTGGPAHTFQLLNPSGAVVASDFQLTNFKYVRYTVPTTGVYTLRVTPFSQGALGAFSVFYVKAPGAAAMGSLPDAPLSGTMGGGRFDSYDLQTTQGTRIFLSLSSTSSLTRMYLVDPTGGLVATSTQSIEHLATQSGRYFLVIGSTTTSASTYELHNAQVPKSNERGLLSGNSVASDTLTPADIDSFTFHGVQGSSAHIVGSGTLALSMYLYSPTGALVAWVTPTFGQTLHASSLPVDGIYTLLVRGASFYASGTYYLAHTLPSVSVSYSALGDSYSSGEGVFPFVGTSVGVFTGCNRSAFAYSQQVRLPFNLLPISWDPNAIFDFIACTGATTENVISSGESRFGEPPQVLASQASPRDLITITIGGNDAQFASIVGLCLAVDNCPDFAPLPWLPTLTLKNMFPILVALVRDQLVTTFTELRNSDPDATILALDYPLVAGGNECRFSHLPGAPTLKLSSEEQKWMQTANVLVNQAVASAAQIAGVHYVSVQDHFEGHGVCGDKDDWLFGTQHIWPKGVFHPNWRGQFEYSRVVNSYLLATQFLWPWGYNSAGLPRNPPPQPSSGPFLGISLPPGIPVPTYLEDLELTPVTSIPACQSNHDITLVPNLSVQISGQTYAANTPVSIDLIVGQQVVTIGHVNSDNAGLLQTTLALPSTLQASELAYVRASGIGSRGELKVLARAVKTRASLGSDLDGDGIPASCDNCPFVSNINQSDQDMDGFGDACDSCPLDSLNDEDQDGICSPADLCPQDPLNDSDTDGICDPVDNCPQIANPLQEDINGDGIGDVCTYVSCLPLEVKVESGELGEISITPGGCPDGTYFEGQTVRVKAMPLQGDGFKGWYGTYQSTNKELIFTMTQSTYLVAIF